MKYILILFLGILSSLVVRAYFILHGLEVADIHSLLEMGELYLNGVNPYLALSYNTYPPLAIYIEALTIQLSQVLNIPFYILIKVWPNLADVLSCLIIFWYLFKRDSNISQAIFWSLVFILNPVSILISAAHGQLDSVVSFLVLLSTIVLTLKPFKFQVFLSGLLLGFSIATKPNPIILLPIFLIFLKNDPKTKFLFLTVAVLPVIVLLLPFLQVDPQYVLTRVLSYSGATDFGLVGVLRGLFYHQTTAYDLITNNDTVLKLDKAFFLISLIFLAFFYAKIKLIRSCLAAYLLFFTIYFGISAQYLSWILPFAVLEKDKMVVPFSLTALISLLGFYLFYNPLILLSSLSFIAPFQDQFMYVYALGNFLLLLTLIFWLGKILRPKPSLISSSN